MWCVEVFICRAGSQLPTRYRPGQGREAKGEKWSRLEECSGIKETTPIGRTGEHNTRSFLEADLPPSIRHFSPRQLKNMPAIYRVPIGPLAYFIKGLSDDLGNRSHTRDLRGPHQ
jgi:hypothetical protein